MLPGQLLHLGPHLAHDLSLGPRELVGQQALHLPVERVPVAAPRSGGLPRPGLVAEPGGGGPDGAQDFLGCGVDEGHVVLRASHRLGGQVAVRHDWLLVTPASARPGARDARPRSSYRTVHRRHNEKVWQCPGPNGSRAGWPVSGKISVLSHLMAPAPIAATDTLRSWREGQHGPSMSTEGFG